MCLVLKTVAKNNKKVKLEGSVWRNHIQQKHPEIDLDMIRKALTKKPTQIKYVKERWNGTIHNRTLYFYRLSENKRIKVVVGRENGEIITAFIESRRAKNVRKRKK